MRKVLRAWAFVDVSWRSPKESTIHWRLFHIMQRYVPPLCLGSSDQSAQYIRLEQVVKLGLFDLRGSTGWQYRTDFRQEVFSIRHW